MPRTNKKPSTANSSQTNTQVAPASNVVASDEVNPVDNEEKEFMEHISKSLQQTTDAFMQKQKQELSALLTEWKTQSLTYLVEERRKMTKTKAKKNTKKQEIVKESNEQQQIPAIQTEQQPAQQKKGRQSKPKEESQQLPEGSASTTSPQGSSSSVKKQPVEKKETKKEQKEPAKKSPVTPTAATSEVGETSAATTTAPKPKKEKKEKPQYLYYTASAQIRIPAAQSALIQEWSNKYIAEEDLYIDPYDPTYGRVTDSHVTICTNLPDNADVGVQSVADATGPLTLNFLDATIYPSKGFDVVVLPIQPTSELFHLREGITKFCTRTSAARRQPHCTIAYVKRGLGSKLLKEHPIKLDGSCICNEIVFVERTGNTKVFQTKKQ